MINFYKIRDESLCAVLLTNESYKNVHENIENISSRCRCKSNFMSNEKAGILRMELFRPIKRQEYLRMKLFRPMKRQEYLRMKFFRPMKRQEYQASLGARIVTFRRTVTKIHFLRSYW